MWEHSSKITNFIAILAIAFLTISCWYAIPKLIRMQITKRTVISPEINPELYSFWIHPPIPIHLRVYLFNVSNPHEILEGMPPNFEEIGPFYFHINRTKVDVTFDNGKDTVSFNEHNNFYFDEELSKPWKLDQVFTVPNVPFVSAALKIKKDFIWPLNHIAHMVLLNYKEPIFFKKTARQLLFEGLKVPFMEKLEEDTGITFMPNNTFGYFFGQNGTNKGPFTVNTGVNPSKPVGIIVGYKNQTNLNVWQEGRNSTCNQIKGTDGSIFTPLITKDQPINIFVSDLCRSSKFRYSEDVNVHGIHGYRFAMPIEEMVVNDENACYCKTGYTDRDKCLGQGAFDLSPCRDGAPVAITQVHFLDADPKFTAKFEGGIKPEREKHQTILDLEPLTGVPLRLAKRVQLNLILERVSSIPGLNKVNNMLIPLIWMEEGASINEKIADKVKEALDFCNFVEYFSKLVATLASFGMLVYQVRKLYRFKCEQEQRKTSVEQRLTCKEKRVNCKDCNDECVSLTSKK